MPRAFAPGGGGAHPDAPRNTRNRRACPSSAWACFGGLEEFLQSSVFSSCTKSAMRTEAREFPRFSLLWTIFRGLCRFAPLALPSHGPTADGPTARQPHQVVRRLPTPRMVQCTSGARASAVLLLAQAKALKQTRPLEGVADVEYPASTSLLQNQQSSGKGAWLQHFASEHVMV